MHLDEFNQYRTRMGQTADPYRQIPNFYTQNTDNLIIKFFSSALKILTQKASL